MGRAWLAWIVVGVLVLVGGIWVASAHARGTAAVYHQTWPKDYAATTCSDWVGRMSDPQRFAAAGQLLNDQRRSIDGRYGTTSEAQVTRFEAGISAACALPVKSGTVTLAGVGSFVYSAHHDLYRP